MASMWCKWCKKILFLAGVCCCVLLAAGQSPASGSDSPQQLLDDVLSLHLGLNGYYIGQHISPEQKQKGGGHLEKDAYEGTYKFRDADLFVVVDKKTDRILALYKRQENVDKNGLKAMVVELMDHFGTPTLLAHDKILYWAFNAHGAISEEDFNKARDAKQIPNLGIIATVKLNSDIEITPDSQKEKEQITDAQETPRGTVYFVITSDPLVQQFMRDYS